eukprot:jgi/Chrzof1/13525/Cz08g00300.t1
MQLAQNRTPTHSRLGASTARRGVRPWLQPWLRRNSTFKHDSPIKRFLRDSLAIKEPVVESLVSLYPALSQFDTGDVQQVVDPNLALLRQLGTSDQVKHLVCSQPRLLGLPLRSWFEFFTQYGLNKRQIWKLMQGSPCLMLQGSVYQTGQAIAFLKSVGYSDLEINTIIIPSHPHILHMDVETQLQPVLQYLLQQGITIKCAQVLIRQHLDMFCPDYKSKVHDVLRAEKHCLSFVNEDVSIATITC